jgi:hypothetical protein
MIHAPHFGGFWGNHNAGGVGGSNPSDHLNHTTVGGPIDGNNVTAGGPINGHGGNVHQLFPNGGHEHIDFNGPNRIGGVELPSYLHLRQDTNGHMSIFDDRTNQTIVDGNKLPKGLFATDDDLSKDALDAFRDKGYDVTQDVLGNRFITEIEVPKAA